MLKKIINLFKRRQYITSSQKEIFNTDINEQIAKKIEEIKKENEIKDYIIQELIVENLLLENNISLFN